MTPAWPPSPMRAMGWFVILILRIAIMAMGASPVVTMAARAAADGAVLILRVVDDDLGRTACSCCRVGAVKASAHCWAGGNEEPVAVLVIDRLALKRVSGAPSAPVVIMASVQDDGKPVNPRPLHCCRCRRLGFGLLFCERSDGGSSGELKEKETRKFCRVGIIIIGKSSGWKDVGGVVVSLKFSRSCEEVLGVTESICWGLIYVSRD